MTPLWREARIQGRIGWNASPFTREEEDSNFTSNPPELWLEEDMERTWFSLTVAES